MYENLLTIEPSQTEEYTTFPTMGKIPNKPHNTRTARTHLVADISARAARTSKAMAR